MSDPLGINSYGKEFNKNSLEELQEMLTIEEDALAQRRANIERIKERIDELMRREPDD